MKKILVIGARGLLGNRLMHFLGERAAGAGRADCDVTDPRQIENLLAQVRPDAVINCAAYTAVDQAESRPEEARRLNADAVEYLGQATAQRGIYFLTISTDYVFNGQGDQPFPEDAPDDSFGPQSVYGQTKLE